MSSLKPVPPRASKHDEVRYLDIRSAPAIFMTEAGMGYRLAPEGRRRE